MVQVVESRIDRRNAPMTTTRNQATKRTQAERHAETRRKILEAAVVCIDTLGFPKTTMQRVARRAGVTVGAVQHHFPSKAELLSAVLAEGFRKIASELEQFPVAGEPLSERVARFVDHCWTQTRDPAFQASMHILQGMRNESPAALATRMREPLADITMRGHAFWRRTFGDMGLPDAEHGELLYFVFSALSGIATFARLVDVEHQPALIQSNLGALKDLLLSKFLRVQETAGPRPVPASV